MKTLEKCPFCGGKVKYLNITLTDEEVKDHQYATSLVESAEGALSTEVLNRLHFSEGEALSYFKAAFDQLAKGKFLYWVFLRDLRKKYNLKEDLDIFIYNCEVYEHERINHCN